MQFAELGGFEEIKKQMETEEKVDAPVSYGTRNWIGINKYLM